MTHCVYIFCSAAWRARAPGTGRLAWLFMEPSPAPSFLSCLSTEPVSPQGRGGELPQAVTLALGHRRPLFRERPRCPCCRLVPTRGARGGQREVPASCCPGASRGSLPALPVVFPTRAQSLLLHRFHRQPSSPTGRAGAGPRAAPHRLKPVAGGLRWRGFACCRCVGPSGRSASTRVLRPLQPEPRRGLLSSVAPGPGGAASACTGRKQVEPVVPGGSPGPGRVPWPCGVLGGVCVTLCAGAVTWVPAGKGPVLGLALCCHRLPILNLLF